MSKSLVYFYPAVIYESIRQSCLSKRFCLLKLKHSEQQWEDINPMMTGHRQSMWFWLNSWKMSCMCYLNDERGKNGGELLFCVQKNKILDLWVQHGTFFFYFSLTRQGLNFEQWAWEDVSTVFCYVVWVYIPFYIQRLVFVLLCVSSAVGSEPGFETDLRRFFFLKAAIFKPNVLEFNHLFTSLPTSDRLL